VALVSPWLAPLARAQEALFDAAEVALPLSIGYLEGSDALKRLDRLSGVEFAGLSGRVVPANELAVGDQTLAGATVKVTVHGIYPALPAAQRLDSAALVVWYPALDPALVRAVPFYAWEYRRKPGRNVGQRLSFVVPLEWDGGLELALHAAGKPRGGVGSSVAGVERRAMRNRFTVDWAAGRPRLQRGVYLLGLDPDAFSTARTLPPPGSKPDMRLLSLALSVEPLAE
jgi:hypothetical protein